MVKYQVFSRKQVQVPSLKTIFQVKSKVEDERHAVEESQKLMTHTLHNQSHKPTAVMAEWLNI